MNKHQWNQKLNYYEIGTRIYTWRAHRNYSQCELAAKAGICHTYLSRIESGTARPSLPVLVSLAQTLDVRVDDLLFGTPEVKDPAPVDAIEAILEGLDGAQISILLHILSTAKEVMLQRPVRRHTTVKATGPLRFWGTPARK